MSLTYIGEQITIYGGFFLLISGVVGNGINIFLFSTVRTYRTIPSSFYFLVCSVVNLIYSTIYLTVRILTGLYRFQLPDQSLVWCKLRPFFLMYLSLISYTCLCLATSDQFLVTSQNVRLRQCSNIQRTHRIVLFVIMMWFLHSIPTVIYYDIPYPLKTCIVTSGIYRTYISVYAVGYVCAIPILVMIVFGWLTYRNIHRSMVLARQQADRQLVKMTLIQVILTIISSAPIGIITAYILFTIEFNKTIEQQVQESSVTTIFSLTNFFYYVGSFYIFLISSNRFCENVRRRLFCWLRRPIRIHPT